MACIYFDAFKSDFHGDAFIAVAAELHRFAVDTLPQDDPGIEDLKKGVIKVGKLLAKSAAKTVMQVLPFGQLGDEAVKVFAEATAKQLEQGTDSWIDEIFSEYENSEDTLKTFQDELRSLIDHCYQEDDGKGEHESRRPLVFIVDELDRCRPDFALELLEKIKHVFSNERVVFVLVNNPEQLEESVRATYGSGIDANRYLHKFYTVAITLPMLRNIIHPTQCDISKYVDYYVDCLNPDLPNGADYKEMISSICSHKRLGFRDVEKILSVIVLYHHLGGKGNIDSKIAWLMAFLASVKVLDKVLFKEIENGRADLGSIGGFLEADSFPDNGVAVERLFEMLIWAFGNIDELDENNRYAVSQWEQAMRMFLRGSDKSQFIRSLASKIALIR